MLLKVLYCYFMTYRMRLLFYDVPNENVTLWGTEPFLESLKLKYKLNPLHDLISHQQTSYLLPLHWINKPLLISSSRPTAWQSLSHHPDLVTIYSQSFLSTCWNDLSLAFLAFYWSLISTCSSDVLISDPINPRHSKKNLDVIYHNSKPYNVAGFIAVL